MKTLSPKVTLSYHTTICIVPPESSWTPISKIRYKLEDKGYYRWPPHINLVYPCIPESKFEDIIPKLVENLQSIEPFDVNFTNFNVFGGNSRGVLYLEPEKSDNLNDLYDAIDNVIRKYTNGDEREVLATTTNEIKKSNKKPFVPHLTVCHFPSANIAWKQSEQFLPFENIKFTLDRVYALTRPVYDPSNVGQFTIAYEFFLGQSTIPMYENNRRFDSMPTEKYQWIIDSEIEYKKSSKRNKKQRKQKQGSDNESDANVITTTDFKENDNVNIFSKIFIFFQKLLPCTDELWL